MSRPTQRKSKESWIYNTPKESTDCRKIVIMVQCYWYMWKCHSHVLEPTTKASDGKKGKQIKLRKYIKQAFLNIKRIVSEETLLNYPNWTTPFKMHTYASDKQLDAVIS